MAHPLGLAIPIAVLAAAALSNGCSSSQDRTSQGSLVVKLSASGPAGGVKEIGGISDAPTPHLLSANVTVSEMEARKADGAWVLIESGLPRVVEFLASANTVTLPADLLPEGHYNALQVRIAQVEPTLLDGTRAPIAPPGTGWVVLIPVDFGVVTGQETIVDLNIRLDQSFKLVEGQFEFEPQVEIADVEHD